MDGIRHLLILDIAKTCDEYFLEMKPTSWKASPSNYSGWFISDLTREAARCKL